MSHIGMFAGTLVMCIAVCCPVSRVSAQTGGDTDGRVDEWVAAAEELRRSGVLADTDSALALLERALDIAPAHEEVLNQLARTHFMRVIDHDFSAAWYDTAAVYAEKLAAHNPVRGLILLSTVYRLKGEHQFALEMAHRAVEQNATSATAHASVGYRNFGLGRHHETIPAHLRALALDSLLLHPMLQTGWAYFHLGMPEPAEPLFRRAFAHDVNEWTAGGLLLNYLVARDYDSAIALTDSLWRADSSSAWTWARLGEAHLFAGNHAEAAHFYAHAIERDSLIVNNYTTRPAALTLAHLYRKAGIEKDLSRLIRLSLVQPDAMLREGQEPWNAFYQFASLALLRDDRDEAIRWLFAAQLMGMPGPVLIETDPLFDDLRGDERFEDILIRLVWRRDEMRRRLGVID